MKKFFKYLYKIFLLIPITANALTPLPTVQAFILTAQFTSNNVLKLNWQIAPGYHLYRDRFSFNSINTEQLQLAPVNLPAGIAKKDDILGKHQVYENNLTIPLSLINPQPGQYTLQVNYQGCADAGFCYPPVAKRLLLIITPTASQVQISMDQANLIATPASQKLPVPDKASQLLAQHNWLLIVSGFLVTGLLLAFTPCVLPMLPILASIVVGQDERRTTKRSFYLSLIYVLAIAITYAIAGVIAALTGSYVQAFFQSPWIISFFSLIFVLLALSHFGLYELRLPTRLHNYVSELNHRQQGGTYIGVFIMGCLSVLIVSPCVTAPLIGTLTYISSTGDILLGGTALFALGIGMGIPLIIVGTFESKWLPKSGLWLVNTKIFFGILLIALAIWLIERIIPAQVTMILWGVFCIVTAIYLVTLNKAYQKIWRNFWRSIGIILLIYGGALLVGALLGNTNPLQPLAVKAPATSKQLNFQTIKTYQNLQAILLTAQQQQKLVLVDFYADWCISCKIMDKKVFQNPRVQSSLRPFILVRVDITANDAQDRALAQALKVIAPPTIIFYDTTGKELPATRIIGEINVDEFLMRVPIF